MIEIEKILKETLEQGSQLAENAGEEFVLAVIAAYAAGREAGKRAAQGAA